MTEINETAFELLPDPPTRDTFRPADGKVDEEDPLLTLELPVYLRPGASAHTKKNPTPLLYGALPSSSPSPKPRTKGFWLCNERAMTRGSAEPSPHTHTHKKCQS